MAASDLHQKESADAPRGVRGGRLPRARARLRSRVGSRGLPVAGLVIGLVIGLVGVLVLWPLVLRPDGNPSALPGAARAGDGDGDAASSSAPLPPAAVTNLGPQAGLGAVPSALDAEWAAYSDRSTCADWAGGDGISSVRLSASQIAWFFSDSYLGPAGATSGFSRSTGLVHNSVVIQTTSGGSSDFATLSGGGLCSAPGGPTAVVSPPQAPGGADIRYWVEDGTAIGRTVFKFYNSYRLGNAPYVPTGTVLAAFPDSVLSADGSAQAGGTTIAPQLTPLPSYTPQGNDSPVVWGAAVMRAGNTVYVYGTQTPDTPVPDRQLYLARVPASQLTQFAAWRFYAGGGRWSARQSRSVPLQPTSSSLSVSSGFSVVQAGQRYWLIQANPIAGNQDIDAYPAASPWGPFDQSAGVVLYRDLGIGLDLAHDYRLMYEARVEPAVSTSRRLVLSYNVNSIAITAGCIPMSWFTNTVTLPRFVSVPMALLSGAGGSAGSSADTVVTAGPSDYPQIAARDPTQWFDEWSYPDGCPPVPGVASVTARPRAGTVKLSWPDAGLGVGYHVYLRAPGATRFALKTAVSYVLSNPARRGVSVTLTGLTPGQYVARVVPVNLRQTTGDAAQVTFNVREG